MATPMLSIFDCFNTQPPEGGWGRLIFQTAFCVWIVSTHSRLKAAGRGSFPVLQSGQRFNTQPPEGGWQFGNHALPVIRVSTHSRLKAAGVLEFIPIVCRMVSTHSRLKAAGALPKRRAPLPTVSTHSRLKAAGSDNSNIHCTLMFQHTAA